ELSFLDIVVLIRGTPRGRRVIGVWEVEKVGKEHLISWYDQSLNRFFPENWRQLALNSPTLVNDAQLRRRYELNVAIIEKLLEQNGKMRAEELAKAVDQQRRAWEEVVAE
ncbi:MAG: hypothetical protein QXD31_04320, partial [Candidatus Caldarchaeum sp.]